MAWEHIPEELKKLPYWVCWQAKPLEDKPGKLRKLPINPRTGEPAQSNNPDTWTDYQTAVSAAHRFSGLGFMFGGGYFGVDIDGIGEAIEDYKSGDMDNIAAEFVHTLGSYAEYSVSGRGLHIICKGSLPAGGRRHGNVEMYERGRFFVMTGNPASQYTELQDCTERIKPLHEKYIGGGMAPLRRKPDVPVSLSDQELLDKARGSKQGRMFTDLYNGAWDSYFSSQSEADFRLCSMLAFWTGCNEEQMDRLFRASGLMREKWDRKQSGSTYGCITIAKAVSGCTAVYEPKEPGGYSGITIGQAKAERKIYSFDDTGNADRMIDRFGSMIRYSYINKSWMWFDGRRWLEDDCGMIRQLLDQVVEDMAKDFDYYMEHAPGDANLDDWEKALKKHLKTSRSNKAKTAALKEAEHRCAVLPAQLDRYPMLLNTPSGIVDLRKGELLHHDPELFLTRITAAEYTDTMECPEWLQFLNTIFRGDRELIRYVQKAVGYSLTGSTAEQCMFFCYGSGRNGKSTMMNILYLLSGAYAANVQPEVLMAARQASGPMTEIARLRGARFVISAEPGEGMRLNEGLIKQLTGGDRITARFLYGKEFEFVPEFKLWIAANHKPVIRGTDTGIWRRMHLIPFQVQIPADQVDRQLPFKLRRELPGILRWAVDGCLAWQKEGLEMPAAVMEATAEYRNEMDILGAFLEECTQKDVAGNGVPASQLYQVYRQWAKNNEEYVMSSTKFGREMSSRFQKLKTRDVYKYYGLRLNWDVTQTYGISIEKT